MKHIINDFKPQGGHHCITNSLKQIFEFQDISISEEMLFGLGGGLGFVYVNLSSAPMISCRIKPFEFEENLSKILGVEIKITRSKKDVVAHEKAIRNIDQSQPVMVYADMAYLNYLNLDESSHFGGHTIIIFGYNLDKEVFYVSDRDSADRPVHTPLGEIAKDSHIVSFKEMTLARGSSHRPFSAKNKWVKYDFSKKKAINKEMIEKAIKSNLDEMLNPPAKLLGINGIGKFSREIKKWDKFSDEKLRLAGITNYFMISKDGGTGGGAFRKMYGNFLIEASEYIPKLKASGENYLLIAKKWDDVANLMMELYQSGERHLLEDMSNRIDNIKILEENEMKNIIEIL